jgi:hypothetical protein
MPQSRQVKIIFLIRYENPEKKNKKKKTTLKNSYKKKRNLYKPHLL